MASAPSDRRPIGGRVDRNGHLVAADPELERLQVEAGASLGAPLALPQLANVARLVQRLRIPVSRRVLAAGQDQDVDMWVRATPDDEDVVFAIEQWSARPASPPRLTAVATVAHERLSPEPLSWSVDEQLNLVTIAPAFAELLGVEVSDLTGQSLTRLFRLEETDEGSMPFVEALATRSGFSGQKVRFRESGKELEFEGEAVLRSDGGFAGFEGTAVADQEPSGAEPLPRPHVDSSIRTALRSPLDNIVRSAEDMVESADTSGRAEYSDYAADIATAAKHLLSVMRSLGDSPEPRGEGRADAAGLVVEAIGLVESQASDRGIRIEGQQVGELPVRGDAPGIVQILVNLIGNAVRYSPPGSTVRLSFDTPGKWVLIHVEDEGPGIDPDDQQRIFEPFQKGSETSEGSGLGLAIARRLARAMGGDIKLQSTPGKGARFTLELTAA